MTTSFLPDLVLLPPAHDELLVSLMHAVDATADKHGGYAMMDEEETGAISQAIEDAFATVPAGQLLRAVAQSHFEGWTLLHMAVARDAVDLARFLISQGSPDAGKYERPFHQVRSVEMCEVLAAAGHSPRLPSEEGLDTPLAALLAEHREDCELASTVDWFLARGDKKALDMHALRASGHFEQKEWDALLTEVPSLSARWKQACLDLALVNAPSSPRRPRV